MELNDNKLLSFDFNYTNHIGLLQSKLILPGHPSVLQSSNHALHAISAHVAYIFSW